MNITSLLKILYMGIFSPTKLYKKILKEHITFKKLVIQMYTTLLFISIISFSMTLFIGISIPINEIISYILVNQYKIAFTTYDDIPTILNIFFEIKFFIIYTILIPVMGTLIYLLFHLKHKTLTLIKSIQITFLILIPLMISNIFSNIAVLGILLTIVAILYTFVLFYKIMHIHLDIKKIFLKFLYFLITGSVTFILTIQLSTTLTTNAYGLYEKYKMQYIIYTSDKMIPPYPTKMESLNQISKLKIVNNTYLTKQISKQSTNIEFAASWSMQKDFNDSQTLNKYKDKIIKTLNDYLIEFNKKVILKKSHIIPNQEIFTTRIQDHKILCSIKLAITNDNTIQLKIDNIKEK